VIILSCPTPVPATILIVYPTREDPPVDPILKVLDERDDTTVPLKP
jgi:hypothetical protein